MGSLTLNVKYNISALLTNFAKKWQLCYLLYYSSVRASSLQVRDLVSIKGIHKAELSTGVCVCVWTVKAEGEWEGVLSNRFSWYSMRTI